MATKKVRARSWASASRKVRQGLKGTGYTMSGLRKLKLENRAYQATIRRKKR